jgi:hypothetical protein
MSDKIGDWPTSLPNDGGLIVFVGHSRDAFEEAESIYSLEAPLRADLEDLENERLRWAVPKKRRFPTLHVWKWNYDAPTVSGGQISKIEPVLDAAHIAVFVFKARIGPVTWDELERSRRSDRSKHVIAVFPSQPPTGLNDLAVIDAYREVLQKKKNLSEDWTQPESLSITPLEDYADKDHLREIVRIRVRKAMREMLEAEQATQHAAASSPMSFPAPAPESGPFIDRTTPVVDYDSHSVQSYRRRLRPEFRVDLPDSLSDAEFLNRGHFRREGRLTHAGVLLFTADPQSILSTAQLRCSRYMGPDKSAERDLKTFAGSVIRQIEEAFDFVSASIEKKEAPTASSVKAETTYKYPMKCIRELIVNAACHRRYDDPNRMTYVRIFNDRIEIASPGAWGGAGLPPGSGEVRLSRLEGQSQPTNFQLAHGIAAISFAEMEGSGLPTALDDSRRARALEPTVEEVDGYVVVTIYPSTDWQQSGVPALRESRITPSEITERGILDELATVFSEHAAASALLERIGFPRERIPRLDDISPRTFWAEVVRLIDAGVLLGERGLERLLENSADIFPGNRVFAPWRHLASESAGSRDAGASILLSTKLNVHEAIDMARNLAQSNGVPGPVELLFASGDNIGLYLPAGAEHASRLCDAMSDTLKDRLHRRPLVVGERIRDNLISRLFIEGPDSARFELNDVPASTPLQDIARVLDAQYDEEAWPKDRRGHRRQSVINHVSADGTSHRLYPSKTLHEQGLSEGETLRICPESTAGCFPGSTLVSLEGGGKRPIAQLKAGDHVLSAGPWGGEVKAAMITEVIAGRAERALVINHGLRLTETHVLWANGDWAPAGAVRIGDVLIDETGKAVEVKHLELAEGSVEVFNLRLESEQDSFFAEGLLVQNIAGGPLLLAGLKGAIRPGSVKDQLELALRHLFQIRSRFGGNEFNWSKHLF